MKKTKKKFLVGLILFALICRCLTSLSSYAMESDDGYSDDSSEVASDVNTEFVSDEIVEGPGYYYEDDSRIDEFRGTGWQQDGNGWRYYISENVYATGWKKIGNYWYYFNPSTGYMRTGWLSYNGSWYYFEPNVNSQNYGRMVVGWKKITVSGSQNWYYFNTNGVMLTGWQYLSDNGVDNWYFFTSDGKMKTGWLSYNNHWYFFRSNGVMVTGWQNIAGYSHYFKSNGQYSETTRRAIIISCAYFPSDIELMGWENCLDDMSFYEGGQFDQIETRSYTSYDDFCDLIDEIKVDTKAGDITYLCLTCHGNTDGTLEFRYDPNNYSNYDLVTGLMLKNKLNQLEGKVVLFLNTCYSGTIINRGETESPETAFITEFLGQNRSGELA
ncbi:MAG: N-acetylmuramoyl-L-alanine amidase family protein, partial [Eubacterium sp.]|nr:N-acetylmuramoyl-L-alanine amidase family protein [Eubacterium sp.]